MLTLQINANLCLLVILFLFASAISIFSSIPLIKLLRAEDAGGHGEEDINLIKQSTSVWSYSRQQVMFYRSTNNRFLSDLQDKWVSCNIYNTSPVNILNNCRKWCWNFKHKKLASVQSGVKMLTCSVYKILSCFFKLYTLTVTGFFITLLDSTKDTLTYSLDLSIERCENFNKTSWKQTFYKYVFHYFVQIIVKKYLNK